MQRTKAVIIAAAVAAVVAAGVTTEFISSRRWDSKLLTDLEKQLCSEPKVSQCLPGAHAKECSGQVKRAFDECATRFTAERPLGVQLAFGIGAKVFGDDISACSAISVSLPYSSRIADPIACFGEDGVVRHGLIEQAIDAELRKHFEHDPVFQVLAANDEKALTLLRKAHREKIQQGRSVGHEEDFDKALDGILEYARKTYAGSAPEGDVWQLFLAKKQMYDWFLKFRAAQCSKAQMDEVLRTKPDDATKMLSALRRARDSVIVAGVSSPIEPPTHDELTAEYERNVLPRLTTDVRAILDRDAATCREYAAIFHAVSILPPDQARRVARLFAD